MLAELTDAEIADVYGHVADRGMKAESPAWAGGEDSRVTLAGGTAGATTQTPLTPEEEIEQYVAAGQALGLGPDQLAKARQYAEDQLRKQRGARP